MNIAATVIAIICIVGLLALGVYYLWKNRNIDKPSYMINDPFAPSKEEKNAAKKAEKAEKKSGKLDKKAEKLDKKAEKVDKKVEKAEKKLKK